MWVVSASRACAPPLHGSSHLSQSELKTKLSWSFWPFCMWTVLRSAAQHPSSRPWWRSSHETIPVRFHRVWPISVTWEAVNNGNRLVNSFSGATVLLSHIKYKKKQDSLCGLLPEMNLFCVLTSSAGLLGREHSGSRITAESTGFKVVNCVTIEPSWVRYAHCQKMRVSVRSLSM